MTMGRIVWAHEYLSVSIKNWVSVADIINTTDCKDFILDTILSADKKLS